MIGLCLTYLLAALRGQLRDQSDRPWRRQLDPLGNIAVSVGLLLFLGESPGAGAQTFAEGCNEGTLPCEEAILLNKKSDLPPTAW